MKVMNNTRNAKRGAALVEYGLIVAGVALVAAAAVSVFGHKTAGMIAASAAILPGAQAADNGPITAGHVIDVAPDASGNITIDTTGTNSLGSNLGLSQGQVDSLVTEPPQ
jgi:pilus assembly protein Flp/PilA